MLCDDEGMVPVPSQPIGSRWSRKGMSYVWEVVDFDPAADWTERYRLRLVAGGGGPNEHGPGEEIGVEEGWFAQRRRAA